MALTLLLSRARAPQSPPLPGTPTTWLRYDPETRAYAARRTTQGKTHRDVKWCLKRSIARQLFKLLERYDQPGMEIIRAA